jgi:hypothetical protein
MAKVGVICARLIGFRVNPSFNALLFVKIGCCNEHVVATERAARMQAVFNIGPSLSRNIEFARGNDSFRFPGAFERFAP